MKFILPLLFLLGLGVAAPLCAENTKNFYTHPKPDAKGGISAAVDRPLTHAIALERDRTSSFKGALSENGTRFVFNGLPTGKYDLILVTQDGFVLEGLLLGTGGEAVTGQGRRNFEERIEKADGFFTKYKLHRFGLVEDGSKILALIERMRDKESLEDASGKKGPIRRFEIAEFDKAVDTWSFLRNRHLYREEDAPGRTAFFESHFVPSLGGVRVIDSIKDLGTLNLPR
jgi:hypothetical protein